MPDALLPGPLADELQTADTFQPCEEAAYALEISPWYATHLAANQKSKHILFVQYTYLHLASFNSCINLQAAPTKHSEGWMQSVLDFFASHENSSQSLQQQVQQLNGQVNELRDSKQCLQQQLQTVKEQPLRKVHAVIQTLCTSS